MNDDNKIRRPESPVFSESGISEIEDDKVQKMLDEWERTKRSFKGPVGKIISAVAITGSLWAMYSLGVSATSGDVLRLIHLLFGFILIPLIYPGFSKKQHITLLDLIYVTAGFVVVFYVLHQGYPFVQRSGFNPTRMDLVIDVTAIVLVMILTRRVLGWPLVAVALFFLFYAKFGMWFPGTFFNKNYTFQKIVTFIYSNEGIYGITIGTSSTFVIIFLILGAFLKNSGAGSLYTNFAYAVAGRFRGGPAKVAVIASALFGTISGSGIANVVTTGAITIPLMKESGFNPIYAAAVESVASTGGQIMPPVMGAAAFLMAEFIGISYTSVCLAATLPALLYFVTCFFIIDLRAGKDGLKGLDKEKLPQMGKVFKTEGYLFFPLAVLLVVLLGLRQSAMRAAFLSIGACVVCMIINGLVMIAGKKANVRDATVSVVKSILRALEEGVMSSLEVVAACACAGIIMALVTLTGIGIKLSILIVTLAGNNLFIALVLTAIVVIVLSMGLPTTACYIIASSIMAPALKNLGIDLLQAHMFIFYFACLSGITPPVALVAYPAAAIAKTDPWKVGFLSFRMAFVGFCIPFIIVYSEAIMLIGGVAEVIGVVITSLLGSYSIAVGLEGWFKRDLHYIARGLMIGGGILLLIPGTVTDLAGLGLMILAYAMTKFIIKQA